MPISKKEVAIVSYAPTACSRGSVALIYDHAAKVFIEHGRESGVSLLEKFETLMYSGSNTKEFQAALELQDFKNIYDEFLSTVKPKFEEGDTVFHIDHRNRPVFFTAGPIVKWTIGQSCYYGGSAKGEKEIACHRAFYPVTPGADKVIWNEGLLKGVSHLDAEKTISKRVKDFIKQSKKEYPELSGAYLVHGNACFQL